jgi:adenosylhomocysteine nucleosidase
MEKVICIIGAVKEEVASIKRAMTIRETWHTRASSFWAGTFAGREVVLVRSGMGKIRASEAFLHVCERFAPSLILSMGYAGAVTPELKIGDLIVADKILEFTGDRVGADWTIKQETRAIPINPFPIDKRLEGEFVRGGLLTVDEVICEPERKRALGKLYPVQAVEMETSALAKLAQEMKIPFLSLRSISDTVDCELPDFSSMKNKEGEVSKLKAGWHAITHPDKIISLVELRKKTQKATARLTHAIAQLVGAMP